MCERRLHLERSGCQATLLSAALFPCPPSESGVSRDDDSTGQRQAGQACHDCVPLRNRALVIPGMGKDWLCH